MSETSQKRTPTEKKVDKLKTKKRDRLASEERLLKAAEETFSRFGFKATTTRMIAKKAGINESLIGRYFEGKLGLFFALIDNHIKEHKHGNLAYPPQDTLMKEILGFAQARLNEHCTKDSEFFKIVLSQALVDAKFLKMIRERIPNFKQTGLEDRLNKLKDDGKIKKEADIEMIIETIENFFHGVLLFELIIHGIPRDKAALQIEYFIKNYIPAFEP
ncbi:TetR/AcrR family transcriptional regulator [Bdellovibrio sp. HCB2-146]|uniref:TetR/AcrR family transcriptional regulator n=1 Tax=Bdellovibrio sp. HCB2-146 TaxID=3394362 RepID=UPI0039BC9862